MEMTETGAPKADISNTESPSMGTILQPSTDTCHSALPCSTFMGPDGCSEFGTTTHFILPRPPYRVLPAPLVLTSHQPRVQRVKARLCEQGMSGRHEGNPQRGRGRQARGSQSCPEGPRAFDQRWPPVPAAGEAAGMGVCVL